MAAAAPAVAHPHLMSLTRSRPCIQTACPSWLAAASAEAEWTVCPGSPASAAAVRAGERPGTGLAASSLAAAAAGGAALAAITAERRATGPSSVAAAPLHTPRHAAVVDALAAPVAVAVVPVAGWLRNEPTAVAAGGSPWRDEGGCCSWCCSLLALPLVQSCRQLLRGCCAFVGAPAPSVYLAGDLLLLLLLLRRMLRRVPLGLLLLSLHRRSELLLASSSASSCASASLLPRVLSQPPAPLQADQPLPLLG